jgi:hypothetical protein
MTPNPIPINRMVRAPRTPQPSKTCQTLPMREIYHRVSYGDLFPKLIPDIPLIISNIVLLKER